MAFSTQRGRPRTVTTGPDFGTPELRLKHALRMTAEPIDLCLEKGIITQQQHWCALHLRWLYTLRYGAPSLTGNYGDQRYAGMAVEKDPQWERLRSHEYQQAIHALKTRGYYEAVMRISIFNELPAFLNHTLIQRARTHTVLFQQLHHAQHLLHQGLDTLRIQWPYQAVRDKSNVSDTN